MNKTERTLENNHMIDALTLRIISDALTKTVNLAGDVVELGCYIGRTTRFICETLQEIGSDKSMHVFDSFCGLPPEGEEDKGSDLKLPEGGCSGSLQSFVETFEGTDFPMPTMNPGWFEDTLPQGLPERISVAFLDGDRYSSMRISLESVLPRMPLGGILIMHDYKSLVGAKKAIDEHKDDFLTFEVKGNNSWATV